MRLKPSGSEWRRLSFIGEGRRPQSGLSPPPPPRIMRARSGEVAEWSNAPDSKSGLRFCRNVGSNPTLSATQTDLVSSGLCESQKARHVARFFVSGRTAEVAFLTRFVVFAAASLRAFCRSPESLAADRG